MHVALYLINVKLYHVQETRTLQIYKLQNLYALSNDLYGCFTSQYVKKYHKPVLDLYNHRVQAKPKNTIKGSKCSFY